MPKVSFAGPDGRQFSFDVAPDTDPTVIDKTIDEILSEQYQQTPGEPSLGERVGTGFERMATSFGTGVTGIVGTKEEATAAAQAGAKEQERISREQGPVRGFGEVADIYEREDILPAAGEFISQVPGAVAEQLPQIGGTLAAGATGAKIGTVFGGPVGGVIGGLVGSGAYLFPQLYGANLEEQAQVAQKEQRELNLDRGKAAIAATGQTAVESVGLAYTIGGNLVRRIVGKELAKETAERELLDAAQASLVGGAARGAGRGTSELPVEVAQSMLSRWQSGQDLLSEDALEEYGYAAYGALQVGPVVGAAASPFERSAARKSLADRGLTVEGETIETPMTPDRMQQLRQEQQTADYMREVEAQELLERQQQEEAAQLKTAEELQAKVNELSGVADTVAIEADGLTDRLDTLYGVKDNLNLIKQNLDRVKANTDVRKNINARLTSVNQKIKEGQELAKTIGVEPVRRARLAKEAIKNLPPELRAKAVADVFTAATPEQGVLRAVGEPQVAQTTPAPVVDQKLTKQSLLDTGLPESAGYTKQLSGLDLSVETDRTKAADIIGRAMENPRVKPEVKESLQALYQEKLATPVAPGQAGLDFTAEPETSAINDQVFDSLGIGKTAVIRKNADLRKADLNDPAQVNFVRRAFEAYRDVKGRSEDTVDKINTFLDSLPEAPVEGVTDGGAEPITTEPSVGRPAGEPSMGVADMGAGAATAQEGAPGGVSGPRLGGLVDTTAGATTDVGGVPPTSAPVTETAPVAETAPVETPPAPTQAETPPAPTQAETPTTLRSAENYIAEMSRESEPDIDDIKAEAMNAYMAGLIQREDMQMIAQADNAVEALTDLELAIEANKNDVVNAVDALRASGDMAGAVTPAFDDAVNKQDPKATLQAIRDDDTAAFNDREQLVAKKLLDMSGPLPTMRMVDSLGNDANGYPILGQYDSIADEIRLVRGAADSHTFLHEMIHAFVHRTIIDQEATGARKPAFKQLQDVYNYVKEKRPDLADTYGMTNLSEFAAEAMSNREFQMQLMGIEYKKDSVFGWFAKQIRTLLGLDDTGAVGNTLFTAMVAVDGLLRTGRDLQLAVKGKEFVGSGVVNATTQAKQNVDTPMGMPLPSTLAEVNKAPNQVVRTEMNKFAHNFANNEVGFTTLFRQQAFDMLAPVAKKLNEAFSQGVKNQFGDVNPLAWVRQAFDHQRIALQVFRAGGLRMTKDGFWEAFDLKDSKGKSVSAQKAIEVISDFAKKEGTSYAVMKGRIATVLEGMRLKDLRDYNRKIEELAREQAASGDIDAAFETRQDKLFLHKTNAEIDALVDIYNKTPEIQEVQRIMNAVRSNLIDAMVKSGRITPEQAESWRAAVNYVPFNRLKEVGENPEIIFGVGRRGIAALARLPEFKGSLERPVANTIDNFMNKMAWMTEQSMRNSAVVRTLNTMVDAGMARKLKSRGEAQNTHLILTMYEKGKPTLFEMQSEHDLAAFLQSPETTGAVINLFSGASRLLRTTVTATPMFAIKQVFDDAQRVMFYSGVRNPLAALGRTLINLPRILLLRNIGSNKQVMDSLERLGVVGDYDFNPINPGETIELDSKARQRSPVRALIHAMEKVTKASDMAARLAVYEQTMKETGDSTLAHNRARELINFNRRGASKFMRAMTHIIPFFNSWAQGTDLMYRGFTGEDASSGLGRRAAAGMFISRILTMTALGSLYAFLMSDDEYYADMSDTVRDRAWVLPKGISDAFGMNQPFKIPVPIELGFLFKSIPERTVQYFKEHAKDENKPALDVVLGTLRDMAGVYGMAPIPALLRPGVENLTNYSFFNHRALVPPSLQNAPKELQFTSSTSEFAKALGKQTNTSPILIDNAMRGYFGLMWSSSSSMIDAMMNPSRPDRNLNQLPFLSIGLMAPVGTRAKDEFYEFREKVAAAVMGVNKLESDPEQQLEFSQKNQGLLVAAPYVNEKLRQLRNLRELKKMYESPMQDMTGKDRREILNDIARMETQVLSEIRSVRNQFMKED